MKSSESILIILLKMLDNFGIRNRWNGISINEQVIHAQANGFLCYKRRQETQADSLCYGRDKHRLTAYATKEGKKHRLTAYATEETGTN